MPSLPASSRAAGLGPLRRTRSLGALGLLLSLLLGAEPLWASEDLRAQIFEMGRKGFEERVRAALLRYVEPASAGTVRIAPSSLGSRLLGRLPRIDLDLREATLSGVRVARGRATVQGGRIDLEALLAKDKLYVLNPEAVSFFLVLREQDLNQLLCERARDLRLRTPFLDLRTGYLRFSAHMKAVFVNTEVSVTGSLAVEEDNALFFQPDRLKLAHLPIPSWLTRKLFRNLNPVASLRKFNFDLSRAQIHSLDDRLILCTPELLETALETCLDPSGEDEGPEPPAPGDEPAATQ